MKLKLLFVGFIGGALVMASGQALADGVSKIGKKIQGEAIVKLDSKELSKAIIVDGQSYAPLRDVTESYGSSVTYSKGVITISTKQEGLGSLQTKKITLETKIDEFNQTIHNLENVLIPSQEKIILEATTDDGRIIRQERLDMYREYLAEAKKNLAEAQTQLVEVNKQIDLKS